MEIRSINCRNYAEVQNNKKVYKTYISEQKTAKSNTSISFKSSKIKNVIKNITSKIRYAYYYKNSVRAWKFAYNDLGTEKTVASVNIIKRKTKEIIKAKLIEQQDEKKHTLAVRIGKKNIGKIYFDLDPSKKVSIPGLDSFVKEPYIMTINFIDCLKHRKKHKGAFNILTQAAFEKALHAGEIPRIIAEAIKMGYGNKLWASSMYAKLLGGQGIDGTNFSREVLIKKIEKIIKKQSYIFEETPQKIKEIIQKEELNMPKTVKLIEEQLKTKNF